MKYLVSEWTWVGFFLLILTISSDYKTKIDSFRDYFQDTAKRFVDKGPSQKDCRFTIM